MGGHGEQDVGRVMCCHVCAWTWSESGRASVVGGSSRLWCVPGFLEQKNLTISTKFRARTIAIRMVIIMAILGLEVT